MKKVDVIKGKPIYVYKRSNYMEQPENTNITKMLYEDITNTTYVYCKNKKQVLTKVCSVIIILCVLLNVFYLHDYSIDVKYNSACNYYNGYLYVNFVNDSSVSVAYQLLDNGDVIAGDTLPEHSTLIYIPMDSVSSKYTVRFTYKVLFMEHSEDVTISVIDRSVTDNGD